MRRALSGLEGADQIALTNRVLAFLARTRPDHVNPGDAVTPSVLLSLLDRDAVGLGTGRLPRPGIPLRHSELLVNGPRDLRLRRTQGAGPPTAE
ncbi:MAG: hypothetical protein H0V89_10260 [Deltaproteobacteria bacterium]|nr:hypothetical protein [Deltaproteobacteria bacterium]